MELEYLPLTSDPSADDFNRLIDAMKLAMSTAGGGIAAYPSAAGTGYLDPGPVGLWGKITSGGTGGKYAWKRVIPKGNGTTEDAKFPDGVSGTTASLPAVEVAGRTDVPADTVVRLEQSEVGPWFDFRYSTASDAGGEWTTVSPVTDVTIACLSGTVTIEVTKLEGMDFRTRDTP